MTDEEYDELVMTELDRHQPSWAEDYCDRARLEDFAYASRTGIVDRSLVRMRKNALSNLRTRHDLLARVEYCVQQEHARREEQ